MDANTNFNILEILWLSGPVVKIVLLILLLASIYSWALYFSKRRFFNQVRANNEAFMNVYRTAGNFKAVVQQTADMNFSTHHILFIEGHSELTRIRGQSSADRTDVNAGQSKLFMHFKEFGMDSIERSLKKGALNAHISLEKGLPVLASIGSLSPFLGLFGTVWGIVDAFTGLSKAGGASLEAVAPGIAEALVATAIGLAVAIPAVWFYNLLNAKIHEIDNEMEVFGQEFLNLVERLVSSSGRT